jgi:hypothetical protein
MTITPEHIANLIFAVSQVRFFEKEYKDWPTFANLEIIDRYKKKIDEILKDMGVEEFIERKQLIETIKLEYNEITS